jgi:hypothetical protein
VRHGGVVFDNGDVGFLTPDGKCYPILVSGHMAGMILVSVFEVFDVFLYMDFIRHNVEGKGHDLEGPSGEVPWHNYAEYVIGFEAGFDYLRSLDIPVSTNLDVILDILKDIQLRNKRFNSVNHRITSKSMKYKGVSYDVASDYVVPGL